MKEQLNERNMMKISGRILAVVLALTVTSALAQSQPRFGRPGAQPTSTTESDAPTTLTKFDLDFPGGTPTDLVAAIQKAMGRPLNAVIPEEYADVRLPPLKMNNVDVAQLFQALELASAKIEPYITGTTSGGVGGTRYSWQSSRTSFGFQTSGRLSDDSIWYFHAEKPFRPPGSPATRICKFYSLAPYLERGFTLDDITTAVQTGWKMLDPQDSSSEISYHKETKLLIAVGESDKLETIDAVLAALDAPKPAPAAQAKPASQPKPDE